jgi:hypothetical protein
MVQDIMGNYFLTVRRSATRPANPVPSNHTAPGKGTGDPVPSTLSPKLKADGPDQMPPTLEA